MSASRNWPADCGTEDGYWVMCVDCRNIPRGEPCPCAGAPCCEKHLHEDTE
jgi:hypothetical protein